MLCFCFGDRVEIKHTTGQEVPKGRIKTADSIKGLAVEKRIDGGINTFKIIPQGQVALTSSVN